MREGRVGGMAQSLTATAVVWTTMSSCALKGVGSKREMRKPMSADWRDILGEGGGVSTRSVGKEVRDSHTDPAGLQAKVEVREA